MRCIKLSRVPLILKNKSSFHKWSKFFIPNCNRWKLWRENVRTLIWARLTIFLRWNSGIWLKCRSWVGKKFGIDNQVWSLIVLTPTRNTILRVCVGIVITNMAARNFQRTVNIWTGQAMLLACAGIATWVSITKIELLKRDFYLSHDRFNKNT